MGVQHVRCGEGQIVIVDIEKIFLVNHASGPGYAVGEKYINNIPESKRRYRECKDTEDWFDIREAIATNQDGKWLIKSIEVGGFLFSISAETARTYLPVTSEAIYAIIAKNKNSIN